MKIKIIRNVYDTVSAKPFRAGDVIECTEEKALALIRAGHAEAAKKNPAKKR